jgi:hypothetical protein
MSIDSQFIKMAREAFNPFVPSSGTEHVAQLLHSLARMIKPRSILEYGSGYTTLFLLSALAENVADFAEEAASLRAKTATAIAGRESTEGWNQAGGKACGVAPGFYLGPYAPKLYCFDSGDHAYRSKVTKAVCDLGLEEFLAYMPERQFSVEALPAEAFPIDLAWNDDGDYGDFFNLFWPKLNPKGGLMIFHNTTAVEPMWQAVNYLKEGRSFSGDLEILTLAEPHKVWQNSCTILRRTTNYQPTFMTSSREQIMADLMQFMKSTAR